MTQETLKYSIWLLPSERIATQLQDFVTDCAKATQTIPFMPHVTVLGDTLANPEACLAAMTKIAHRLAPATATPLGTAGNEGYFTSYYLKFSGLDLVQDLNTELLTLLGSGTSTASTGAPVHMSLGYGPAVQARRDAFDLSLPDSAKQPMMFDTLALTTAHNKAAVEDWEVLQTITLKGPSART